VSAEQVSSVIRPMTVSPLSARSVALSTLLGFHPPALPVGALIRVGRLFDIAEGSMRAALSRMAASGDVEADQGVYQLSDRLLARQARQDEEHHPHTTAWDGTWEMEVVTAPPRPLAERTALRRTMAGLRLAELREGVWLRPRNLERERPDVVRQQCTPFVTAEVSDDLASTLWDLPGWADTAQDLIARLEEGDPADLRAGFLLMAEVIRHLALDPCLPEELRPEGWPAPELRRLYQSFATSYPRRLARYMHRGATTAPTPEPDHDDEKADDEKAMVDLHDRPD